MPDGFHFSTDPKTGKQIKVRSRRRRSSQAPSEPRADTILSSAPEAAGGDPAAAGEENAHALALKPSSAISSLAEDSGGHDPTRPIGRGNPSRKTQIQKGEVRNPHGRAGKAGKAPDQMDTRSLFLTEMDATLSRKRRITIEGKTRKVSAHRANLEKLMNESLQGSDASQRHIQSFMRIDLNVKKFLAAQANQIAGGCAEPLTQDQIDQILADYTALVRRGDNAGGQGTSDAAGHVEGPWVGTAEPSQARDGGAGADHGGVTDAEDDDDRGR